MPSNPFRATITGVSSTSGDTPTWYPDYSVRPFNIGVGCVVNSTSVAYTLQHTFDDITSTSFVSSAANWLVTSTAISGASTSASGNFAYPVSGIRVISTAGSSTGTIEVTFIQAG